MAHLSFTTLHGDLIWRGLVALGSFIGLAILLRRRHARERRIVARSLGLYRDASSAAVAGTVVLRGTLRGGELSTFTSLERHGGPLVHTATAPVWLDVAGERVDFATSPSVIRGTKVSARWWPSSDRAGLGARRTFTLREGDEVLALASCRHGALGDVSYRDTGGGWVLDALPHRDTVELLAARPLIRARPLGAIWSAGMLGAGAIASLLVLGLVGLFATAGDSDWALALPGSRDHALVRHERAAADRFERYAIREVRGRCDEAVDLMLGTGDLDLAIETAHRCDLPNLEGRALIQLGRFREANALLASDAPPNDILIAALGAGDWARAATVVKSASTTEHAGCIEALMRTRAKQSGAAADLARFATTDALCAQLASHARVAAPLTRHADMAMATQELGGDLSTTEPRPFVFYADPSDRSASAAVLALYRGDFATARAKAADADAAVHEIPTLSHLVALHDGPTSPVGQVTHDDAQLVSVFTDATPAAARAYRINVGMTLDAPFVVIRQAAVARDLARRAGQTELAASWQAVMDRHLALLADPDIRNLLVTGFGRVEL